MPRSGWTLSDTIAFLISLLAVLAAYLVHDRVFERMAHLEDEMAYVWQAQAIAGGQLSLPSPESPKSFLYPFVVDHNGQRFGKYPLGWPVVLAIGEKLGARHLVNPLLAGLGIWLTYLLGKHLFGTTVGLLAAGLTLSSPFFLMNSGSLLSHPLGLALSLAFVLAWMEAFTTIQASRRWLPAVAAGGSLGLLALTRPFTAVAVGLPFAIHGLYLLIRSDRSTRKLVLWTGIIAAAIASLHLGWQYAVTGDPLLNPYTLWWGYDRIGFGSGVGRIPGGHTLNQAWVNTRFNIHIGRFDLFGWAGFSWIFLPLGLFALLRDRNWRAFLPVSAILNLFVCYFAYWIGAWVFGPRYYFEGLFSLTLLSALGIAWLAGWPTLPGISFPNYAGWIKARPLGVTALVCLLLVMNLNFYLPGRLDLLNGLYGVRRSRLEPFLTPQAMELTPALVVVHTEKSWIEYGTLLELETPFLDTPFILVYSREAAQDALAASSFPDRRVLHYYPLSAPSTFNIAPRPPN
jgi:hypothetical protein